MNSIHGEESRPTLRIQYRKAAQTVLAGQNQNIAIDGNGIRTQSENGKYEIRITDSMIAFTNDNWASQSAKLALGRFSDPNFQEEMYGIVGTLIAGEQFIFENVGLDGIKQFKFDNNGAFLYNSTLLLQQTGGGQVALDPSFGLAIGNNQLYTLDDNNRVTLDKNNANLYTDTLGNLTMKGTVYAKDGEFTGTIHALSGEFSGSIKASTLDGKLVGGKSGNGIIEGVSLNIGNGNFTVDSGGNTVIK